MIVSRDTIIDGRYRAMKRLGAGGMAEVWCAEDEVLGRRVALKLLGGRYASDPEFRERFRREAQAAAGLTHPNIVGVFDRSEWEGTPYIAMELVDGQTLKELVTERGPLPPHIAVGLVEQILRALAYAHRRGIVHRDIKPQNVILDPEGEAKVADFGIARAGHSEMTQTGSIVGTVQYLSPEQANGHPVDRRSDLYSAGIVLYELLTGQVPFDGEAPVSIALKHVNERPVPPGQLRPGIPPALEAVVLRALEKDPNLRFQSAEEFIAALEQARHAPTRPIVVEPPPVEPWAEEEVRRSRWWIWALVALVAVGIAVAAYFALAGGEKVTVPNLVGRNADDAIAILQRRGLEPDIENVVSDEVPRDEVISQNPDAGSEVREGGSVEIRVSAGREQVTVPAVVGSSQDDAEQALADAGFKSKVEREYSDTVPEGDVISASPEQGRAVSKGRTITLTVSRGKAGVTVPGVVGNTRDGAEQALQSAGLTAQVTERESSEPPGTVLEQNPASGATVEPGSAVAIVVAKERPQIPDVTTDNPTVEEATQALEDAGYKVKTVERQGDPSLVGRVIGQSPAAGTRRSTGGTVTIAVVPDPNATPTATPTP
ncbi:PASTA domain-containing protein [Solirubrobacter phytolaccae]|uniref:non-specific serine/threonine protein kinase n=1 Tax=Solirubrobacter phytolaccae TaxID=1404360 RepID=A0A9X3SDY7_9ACTN|nr:PASTA domain-containing protein [Solirubrobacter phytolaccae]MDA0184235.1 PASTA domain-containing protein [Solirubrobacter phytolaccae]